MMSTKRWIVTAAVALLAISLPAMAVALHADTWGDDRDTWDDDPDTGIPRDTADTGETGIPPHDVGPTCKAPEVLNPQFRVEPEPLSCLQIQKYLDGRYDNIWQFRASNNCRGFSIWTERSIFTVGKELRPGVTAGIDVPGYRYEPVTRPPGTYTERYEFSAGDQIYNLEYSFRVPTAEERKHWKSINCGGYQPPDRRDTGPEPDTQPPPEPDTSDWEEPPRGCNDANLDCDDWLRDTGGSGTEWGSGEDSTSQRGNGCGCSNGESGVPFGTFALLVVAGLGISRRRRDG